MKMTSAIANKLIRQLEEEKDLLINKEQTSYEYLAADGEKPVIPDYDYNAVNAGISELDWKIAKIKHALNLANATAKIDVQGEEMSVDEILIKMAQLNKRKNFFNMLRKNPAKERVQLRLISSSRTAVPEYRYMNYDIEAAGRDFESVSAKIIAMQLALDKHNQTEEFEVEI